MAGPETYRRDTVTWTGFSLMGVWAMFLYFVGPAAGAIGSDLGLSDAATGSIGTALAAGTVSSALLGPPAVRRWGRRGTLLRVLPGLAAAALLLALSGRYVGVLAAVAGIGLLGAITANTATAALADHHRRHPARAITEANAAASWLGVVSPALLGAALALPTGWQGAALVLAWLPLLALLRVRGLPAGRTAAPTPPPGDPSRPLPSGRMRLPAVFWLALIVVACSVSMEFIITFWAAPLIGQRTGASLPAAAGALSLLTLGMALARTFAAPLASHYPIPRLIIGCNLLAAAGLAGLLAARSYPAAAAALLVIGLGLSLLFPYAQAWALELAGRGLDRAVALTAVAAGLALGLAPLLLGLLAGGVGLTGAMSAGFAIAAVGIATTLAVRALQPARPATQPPAAPR